MAGALDLVDIMLQTLNKRAHRTRNVAGLCEVMSADKGALITMAVSASQGS